MITIAVPFIIGFIWVVIDAGIKYKEHKEYEKQQAIYEEQQQEELLNVGKLETEYGNLMGNIQIAYYEDEYPSG